MTPTPASGRVCENVKKFPVWVRREPEWNGLVTRTGQDKAGRGLTINSEKRERERPGRPPRRDLGMTDCSSLVLTFLSDRPTDRPTDKLTDCV